jgi:tyrosine-protein phosphatase SIW14
MRSGKLRMDGRWWGIAIASVFLLAAMSTAASAQGATAVEPRYRELPNFHQVNPRLHRGGQPRPGGIGLLSSLGVKTVINLRDDDERAEAEGREATAAGLRYLNIPLARWDRPAAADIERVLALIDDPANGVVFVHCAHGADRTGVVLAAYRISRDGWTSEQAKAEAKQYGMKFWQRGMKDFIHDYYRDRAAKTQPATGD